MTIPFGKWRGYPLDQVPLDYVRWCQGEMKDLPHHLALAMEDEILRREYRPQDTPTTPPPDLTDCERWRRRVVALEEDLANCLHHHGDCHQPRRRAV